MRHAGQRKGEKNFMKRAFVLTAALVTSAALNGTADAAQMNGRTGQAGTASGSVASSRFDGVIVAKDAKRKAVVTVSRNRRSA